MNSLEKYEFGWQLKAWKLNCFMIAVIMALCFTANMIGHRLILFFGFAMYSGAFLRLMALMLINVLRTYMPSRILMILIVFIALCELFIFAYGQTISHLPYPAYFINAEAYKQVFSDAWHGYVANILTFFLSIVIDMLIFAYLYFRLRLPFFLASIISAFVMLFVCTIAVMYAGYILDYPKHGFDLIWHSLLTNYICLLVLGLIFQPFVYWVHQHYFEQ